MFHCELYNNVGGISPSPLIVSSARVCYLSGSSSPRRVHNTQLLGQESFPSHNSSSEGHRDGVKVGRLKDVEAEWEGPASWCLWKREVRGAAWSSARVGRLDCRVACGGCTYHDTACARCPYCSVSCGCRENTVLWTMLPQSQSTD